MNQWRELFRNKKMLYGLGAAAALGVVVLVMRKKQPGGDGQPAEDVAGGTTTLQPGTYDSTGSDIYNGLQALYAGQDARWQELIGVIGDVKSKLDNKPPGAPSPTSPKNPGPLKPGVAGTRKVQPGGATWANVKAPPTGGRWTWENLVSYWYNTTGWSAAQKQAAARTLADVNKFRWFGKPPGPNMPISGGYGGTVAGGVALTVPGRL